MVREGAEVMADRPRVSVAELADGAAHTPLLDDTARPVEPLVVVELADAPDEVLERAVARARDCDRLLVGIACGPPPTSPLVDALDLTLATEGEGRAQVTVEDPVAEAEELSRVVAGSPQASLALAQVLRATETLPPHAALDVESFAYSTLLGGLEFRRWLERRGPRSLPPPADSPVLVDRSAGLLRITLNRPERRNAYGRELRDRLVDALRVPLLDPSITEVLLDGAGPSFCSGGDLDEFGTTPDLATAHLLRTRAAAGPLIHRLGARIEVRVHGHCVGAGVELPAFAATVVADPGTSFRLPEIAMGLIPGAGGTVSLPRRIGRWRTLHLALTGRPLPARTALAWGLVDRLASASGR
jgi:enoyl-CoA hydratase/carnithine racemase